MLETLLLEQRGIVQDIAVVVLCAAAFIWGGGPEKAVAATWLIVFEASELIKSWLFGDSVQLGGVDWYVASIDALAALLFVWIALFANRNYTLGIAGLQVLALMAHLARSLADLISPIAYAVMFIAPGWGQIFLLGIGIARHMQRSRKHGQYRDWRIAKPSISLGVDAASPAGKAGWQQAAQPTWRDDVK